ncbi:MAG: M48 family metallopeptidase [Flavisolibacter sp.]|nr:M48 family metallopeptidase [Flavisolibacter sp.]
MVRYILGIFLAASVLVACSTNPITGRSQLSLVPESELQSMANQQYRQFLTESKVVSPSGDRDAEMVRRVGNRIATAVTNFYKQQGLASKLEGYKWEFNLIRDPAANAWAMPGGKVAIYTGLLPITRNEAALANVMGHEIAHALFQHGNERMSQGLAAQGLGTGLAVALANKPAATQNIFNQAFGVGTTVGVLLPFGRKQELESDRYGMIFAAMAGYNPREAIALWERMEAASNGNKPPEFLSTHPSEGRRKAQLEKYLPEALKYYKPGK